MRSTSAVLIRPDDVVEIVSLVGNDAERLTQLQSLVGGFIEGVSICRRPRPFRS